MNKSTNMCDRVTCLLLIIFLLCAPAFTEIRNCTDCIGYKSCDAAVVAMTIQNKDPAVDAQLNNAFCGFDGGRLMVCCSELTAATETLLTHTIDNHPNLALLPKDCGVGKESYGNRLSGGIPVTGVYEFPWMVLISYKTRYGPEFRCGGSLINKLYVLVAAECFGLDEVLEVRVGKQNLDTATDCLGEPLRCIENTGIQEIILHPEHVRQTNDIALLRLKSPMKHASTICLPVTSYLRTRATDNVIATVTEWPASEKGFNAFSQMRYTDVIIKSAQYCREQYNTKTGEIDKMLNKICCSYPDSAEFCIVSGAPLQVWDRFGDGERYIQYGIASYGYRFCGLGPDVYTDVTKYMIWILNTIRP